MKQWLCIFLAAAALVSSHPENTGSPSVSVCGNDVVELFCGEHYTEEGCQAFDAEGNDISERVEITGEVCTWLPAEYELTYSVKESDSTTLSCTRKIRVLPKELPETVNPEKTIYLTFDDGPGEYTDELLTLLDDFDAKATFFIVGKQLELYPEQIDRIVASGHSAGIHCYYHEYKYVYSSENTFVEDMLKTREMIYELSGYTADILRFPGGSATAAAYAGNKIDGGFERLSGIIEDLGMRYYDWDVSADPMDDGLEHSVRRTEKTAESMDYTIVLEHDTKSTCVEATRKLLEWGIENGYSFKALDLSVPETHSITQS